jgi:hypothetical protein
VLSKLEGLEDSKDNLQRGAAKMISYEYAEEMQRNKVKGENRVIAWIVRQWFSHQFRRETRT